MRFLENGYGALGNGFFDFFKGDLDVAFGANFVDVVEAWIVGTEEVEAFRVGGEGAAFGDDVPDRVFPLVDDFDFDQFGFGEEVDESPFGIGFDFAAELGLKPVSDVAFGVHSALDFAPVGEKVGVVEFADRVHVGRSSDVGTLHDFFGREGHAEADGFLENEVDAVGVGVEFFVHELVDRFEVNDDAIFRDWVSAPVRHFLNPSRDTEFSELPIGKSCVFCSISGFKSVVFDNGCAGFGTDDRKVRYFTSL